MGAYEMEDIEGINQEHMHKPWTQTAMWGLARGGERMVLGAGGEMEKKWEQL